MAGASAPVMALGHRTWPPLSYYRVDFLGAELPFPLEFKEQRTINIPNTQDCTSTIQLPSEVADRLMTVYIERTLPRYPLFLKKDIHDMFTRFKASANSPDVASPDEQFVVCMIMAVASLTSKARDYRKLVSVAESLRHDAFVRLDFASSVSQASTRTIQQLLLLAQYGYLLPASTNLWQVVGDATRIALELGLHQEPPTNCDMTEEDRASRIQLYWTVSWVLL